MPLATADILATARSAAAEERRLGDAVRALAAAERDPTVMTAGEVRAAATRSAPAAIALGARQTPPGVVVGRVLAEDAARARLFGIAGKCI